MNKKLFPLMFLPLSAFATDGKVGQTSTAKIRITLTIPANIKIEKDKIVSNLPKDSFRVVYKDGIRIIEPQ